MLASAHGRQVQQSLGEVAKGYLSGVCLSNGLSRSAGSRLQARHFTFQESKYVLTQCDHGGVKRARLVVEPGNRVRDDRTRGLDRGDGLLWRLGANGRKVHHEDVGEIGHANLNVALESKINDGERRRHSRASVSHGLRAQHHALAAGAGKHNVGCADRPGQLVSSNRLDTVNRSEFFRPCTWRVHPNNKSAATLHGANGSVGQCTGTDDEDARALPGDCGVGKVKGHGNY